MEVAAVVIVPEIVIKRIKNTSKDTQMQMPSAIGQLTLKSQPNIENEHLGLVSSLIALMPEIKAGQVKITLSARYITCKLQ